MRSWCHTAGPIEPANGIRIGRPGQAKTDLLEAVGGRPVYPARVEDDVVERTIDVSTPYGLESRDDAPVTEIAPAIFDHVRRR
jgi:hypothetical protein